MRQAPPEPAAPSSEEPAASSVVATVAPPTRGAVARAASGVLTALRFYSRLPVPVFAFEPAPHAPLDPTAQSSAVAVAGALLGTIAAGALYCGVAVGLPPLMAALLALAVLVLITGALHEDGLADTADGVWGGKTPERRLEIMRDSRIGSYGVLALVLSVGLRATALAAVIDRLGAVDAALALIAVAAVSRVAGLVPLAVLPSARADGTAAAVQVPTLPSLLLGSLSASALALASLAPTAWTVPAGVAGVLAAFLGAYLVACVARAKIGGFTGDIAGAAQQISEVAMLVVLVAASAA